LSPIFAVSEKMRVFWPKIGQLFAKISKILEINKNYLNTPLIKIWGYLEHF
jgi:hypothetical protein